MRPARQTQWAKQARAGRGLPWLSAALFFLASLLLAPRALGNAEPGRSGDASAPDASALEKAFQDVARRVAPSVVGIRVQRLCLDPAGGRDLSASNPPPERRVIVHGSGVVIAADGLILTNEHVVQSAAEIRVALYDGSVAQAEILSADPRSDLAVLKVPRSDLVPVRWCDWQSVTRGQWTVVVGNPFGLGNDGQLSVAVGVVANLGRQLPGLGENDDRFYYDMMQITAPINPGHSGGPVFNLRGELIGLVTAMHTRTPADEGVGFAIPMNPPIRRVIDTLCHGRPYEYGYLGVTVRALSPEERESLGLPLGEGVVVQAIEPDGPAARAGIAIGDLLCRLDGAAISSPGQLAERVGHMSIGQRATLEYLRDGRAGAAQVTIARRDPVRVSWLRRTGTSTRADQSPR